MPSPPIFPRMANDDDEDGYGPDFTLAQMQVPSSCLTCRHKRRDGRRGCEAFPDAIPSAIAGGEHDHKTPFPGDGGIMYEPAFRVL